MKLTNLKYIALIGLLLFMGAEANAQLKVRFATNVRYIAGGYIDKRPMFNTLEAALNDVKAYATVNNPYVFWVDSDTLQVADWDSVFTESGLTMKDSIDVYYVAEGKIKWAGFGFGGTGGTGSTPIPTQTQVTTHYSYPNWNKNNGALATWIRNLAQGIDSVDQHIWDLIVYSDSIFLYIENDTLKFRASALSQFGARPDTTLIVYKASTQTITGNKTYSGESIFSGSVRIPDGNNKTSTSRILWSAGNNLYWSGSGAAGDSSQLAEVTTSTGLLRNTVVGYGNIVDAVYDSVRHWIQQPHIALGDDGGVTPAVSQNVYTKLTPGWTEENKLRITQAGDSITVNAAEGGNYFMQFGCVVANAGTDDFTLQVRVNNVAVHTTRFTGQGANEYATISTFHYFADLVPGDDISLYITNTANNNDPALTYMNWYMARIHE